MTFKISLWWVIKLKSIVGLKIESVLVIFDYIISCISILHTHLGSGDWGYHAIGSHECIESLLVLLKPLWESRFKPKSNLRKLNSSKQLIFSEIMISGFTIYLVNDWGYIEYVAYCRDVKLEYGLICMRFVYPKLFILFFFILWLY